MRVSFAVDGHRHVLDAVPDRRLIDILREDLDIMGPKQSCGVGRCGACLVIMDDRPINACLVMAARLEGAEITTVAGLGPEADRVRDALAQSGAVQCGYCASGWMTLLTWLLGKSPLPTAAEAETLLSGQLCRCTGYGGIRRALAKLLPSDVR